MKKKRLDPAVVPKYNEPVNIIHILIKGNEMSVPSKANIDKLDNPARPKTNHRSVTEPSV